MPYNIQWIKNKNKKNGALLLLRHTHSTALRMKLLALLFYILGGLREPNLTGVEYRAFDTVTLCLITCNKSRF